MTQPPPPVHHFPLREGHAHLAQHARAMTMLQLHDCADVHDCLERIARRAREAPRDQWLLGVGLRVESFPDPRYPGLRELDEAAGVAPVCLWSFDHHALVVNSAALRAAAISHDTPDPDNGRIVRDCRGHITGLMLERAAKLVWERIPQPPPEQRPELLRAAAADLASHGFVEVHDLLSQPWLGPVLAQLSDAGELPLKVELYPLIPDLPGVAATASQWQRDDVRLGGGKLFADGTLNSRTAYMLGPYADPLEGLPRGQCMLTHKDLTDALDVVASLNLTLAVHAIGDAAVRHVLDACEARPGARCRIEHAELMDEADIPRFRALGVTASIQPCHLLTDMEVLRRSLPNRLDRVMPLRELIDSGLEPGRGLIFGSDTPIVRPHPQDSIRAAVHRGREGIDPIAPEQAIGEDEAWRAFTPR
jgi:predicted amidohydrolase YtcJ